MHPPRQRFYLNHGKRLFDFSAALIVLTILLLPMGCVAMMLLICDGPPALFRQRRVGRNGRLFVIYKFRTMRISMEPSTTITVRGDRRITGYGKILRFWKIDELPQLFNILKGDMSFVGPRPDVPGYMDKLEGDAASLLQLRPGITGPATLAFRDEEELLTNVDDPRTYNDEVIFQEKVRLNMRYLREISLRRDLHYILATILKDWRVADSK